jgi:hypothetical protein
MKLGKYFEYVFVIVWLCNLTRHSGKILRHHNSLHADLECVALTALLVTLCQANHLQAKGAR